MNRDVDFPRYLCAGSIGVDVIVYPADGPLCAGELSIVDHISLHVGGCAANTSLALAKLGCSVDLCGHIGDDPLGNYLCEELGHHKVRIAGVKREFAHPTGSAVVAVSSTGERSFLYAPGANTLLQYDDVASQLDGTDFLHLSDTFLLPNLDGQAAASLLAQARALGVVTSVDTAWDPGGRWLQILKDYLPHTCILFTSLHEARMLVPQASEPDICTALINGGARVVVLKMGARGALIATNSECSHVPSIPTEVIDSTGAGDCFNAGFLAAYGFGASPQQSAYIGSALAAMAVTEFGATSNVRPYEEVLQAAQKFYGLRL